MKLLAEPNIMTKEYMNSVYQLKVHKVYIYYSRSYVSFYFWRIGCVLKSFKVPKSYDQNCRMKMIKVNEM